jgi:hypothetical protein
MGGGVKLDKVVMSVKFGLSLISIWVYLILSILPTKAIFTSVIRFGHLVVTSIINLIQFCNIYSNITTLNKIAPIVPIRLTISTGIISINSAE